MRLKGLTLATATAFAVAVPPAGAQRTLGATFFIPMVVVPALLVSHCTGSGFLDKSAA